MQVLCHSDLHSITRELDLAYNISFIQAMQNSSFTLVTEVNNNESVSATNQVSNK